MAKEHLSKEDALLRSMVQDAIQLCSRRSSPCFVGFLDEREQDFVRNLMERSGRENYMLWGGYPDAERVVFGAFTPYDEEREGQFPIVPVTISYRRQDLLSHRDFLGALMALGIERSTVGDLLIEPGRCVLFLREEICPYVTGQIEKVGSVGVTIREGAELPYPPAHRFRVIPSVVSSLRADCIVASCTGMSREKVKTWIASGLVTVNYVECRSPSVPLSVGDKIAIRGKGKFCLSKVGDLTRKGRIGIEMKKYV